MNESEVIVHNILMNRGCNILTNGWPDFLVEENGTFFGVEVKGYHDRLRGNQFKMLNALRLAGIQSFIYKRKNDNGFNIFPFNNDFNNNESLCFHIRQETKWEDAWDRGRYHFIQGIDMLKSLGISYDMILRHMRGILTTHQRDNTIMKVVL